MFQSSSRQRRANYKPEGFYSFLSGRNIHKVSEFVDSMAHSDEQNNDAELVEENSPSIHSSESDEELKNLKQMEREIASDVQVKRKHFKSAKARKHEEEKRKIRERIEALRQESQKLELALQEVDDSSESSRKRHGSKSLPDSSEYQKLLEDITRAGEGKLSKKAKKKKFREAIKQVCLDGSGKVKIPSAVDLKKLTHIAESNESLGSTSKTRSSTKRRDGKVLESEDSSSDSSSSVSSSESESDGSAKKKAKKTAKKKKKGKKIVSGRLEKVDETDIIKPVKYAHSRLDTDFVESREFDKLPFHHLVAGELELIQRRKASYKEKEARIGILKYLAYHYAFLDTEELRRQYDSLLKRVERGELEWDSGLPRKLNKSLTFRREMCNKERDLTALKNRSDRMEKSKALVDKKEKSSASTKSADEVFYCADFNRGKCTFTTSHLGKFAGREVMKLHICKKCLAEDGHKKAHAETEEVCPHNKA